VNVERLIKHHEGYRRQVYTCTAGKQTIGFGRNLDDVGIDAEEATYLLNRDIERAVRQLMMEPYWLDLGEVRQAVLIDMAMNMGWPRFALFKQLRAALGKHDYALAADEMRDSNWFGQVGTRSRRLVRMMESGDWPADIGRDP
jgi:lysozyme